MSSSSSSSSNSHDKEEADKEAARLAEQAQLDDEMLKRRERVRQWQEEKAMKMKVMVRYNKAKTTMTDDGSTKATTGDGDANEENDMIVDGDGDAEEAVHAPGWSLEDEDEEVMDDTAMSSNNDDDDPIGPPPLPPKPDRYADDESIASMTPSRAMLKSIGALDDGDETSDYMSLDIEMPSYDHSGTGNQLASGSSSAGKVNPYGSNFITLDQIMGMLGSGGGGSGRSNSGWESDASSHGGGDSTVSLTRKKQKGKRGGVVGVGVVDGEGSAVEGEEEREVCGGE